MDELTRLARKFGTDKAEHGFCGFYHGFMAERRLAVTSLLEIGIRRGESLLMWAEYFPNAVIHGLDLSPPPDFTGDRIVVHQGDQANPDDLERIVDGTGAGLDIVVDDGGHTMAQQQFSLGHLFPRLAPGGLYVVEDIHTSFVSRVGVAKGGRLVGSYETGALLGQWTTYDMLAALHRSEPARSDYLPRSLLDRLDDQVTAVELFDRDGDRRHMTSVVFKRPA